MNAEVGPAETSKTVTVRSESELGRHYDKFLDCVHCGLCLPACPTYAELGLEMDSPRGRIYLMRAYAEGRIDITDNLVHHVHQCLNCRACETACPAGVDYGSIVELARAEIEENRPRPSGEQWLRDLIFKRLLPSSDLLRLSFLPLRVYQKLGIQKLVRKLGLLNLLPERLRTMESMLPQLPQRALKRCIRSVNPAEGQRQHRVGLVSGCVMNEIFTHINVATVKVLTRNGCEVVVPDNQTCCGALQAHSGERETAKDLARVNIGVFEQAEVDVVIINAAGCGAQLKEYDKLLKDDPEYRDRAQAFTDKVRDVCEFLDEISLNETLGRVDARVAYHDACHLAHGQQIREQPRSLLRKIPGLELVELGESDWCCGSAGVYNITHPEMAERLLDRKITHVNKAAPDIVATGNPGCILQIQHGIDQEGKQIEVVHPVQLLNRAYQIATNRS